MHKQIQRNNKKNSIQAATSWDLELSPESRRKLSEGSRGGGSCGAGELHFGAVAEEKLKIFKLACLMPWSNLILKDCYLVSFIEACALPNIHWWSAAGRFAFSWFFTKDSVACRDCRAAILMERWSSFFSMRILRAVSPNTCIRISVVGEAKNQCPNRAECLLFHMWMAFLSFASLCCWWWVVGTCDFDVFGANDVGNNAQLADCDGNHPWLHFYGDERYF